MSVSSPEKNMIYTEEEVKQKEDALKGDLIKFQHKLANQNKELERLKGEKEKYERSLNEIQVSRDADKKEIAKLNEEKKNIENQMQLLQSNCISQIAEYEEVLFIFLNNVKRKLKNLIQTCKKLNYN